MNLLVIGHSVLDHIKEPTGFRFQPGGIFYTTLGLSILKQPTDDFYLCTLQEHGHETLFADGFQQFDLQYSAFTDRIPRVHLTIFDEKERCERFENLNNPVKLPDTDYRQFDGILINMISGFELSLPDLINLRKRYSGPIYFDVHSLARGVGDGMVREFRIVPEFKKWAKNLTIIQANEHEIFTLSDNETTETGIAGELLRSGVQLVIVTKGEKGVTLYTLSQGDLICQDFTALNTSVVNKVGCGDIFGAYFFYHYIAGNNVLRAIRTAITASGCVTTYSTINEFSKLPADVEQYNN